MGFRRLRGRLDQLQGSANLTMDDIQALVDDLQDGFGVRVQIDAAKAMDLANKLIGGVGLPDKFDLPITVKVDPTIDTKD